MNYRGLVWIYYIALTFSLAVYGMLTYIAYHLLYSISSADIAVIETNGMMDNVAILGLVTTVPLLLMASYYFWVTNKAKHFWAVLLYMAITTIAYYWFFEEQFHFKKQNGLWKGEFSLSYFGAAIVIVLWSVGIYTAYSLIKYLRKRKMKTA